jgi:uncharacterized protein (TIGR03437 family)
MRKSILALVVFAPLAFGQPQTFTYTYSGLPLPVYPDDWDTVTVISMFVPRSISISKVTVGVTVQYSGVGDLNVYMFSPYGTRTKLLERNCGSLVNIDTTFDDNAPSKFNDYCPTTAGQGPFRGNEPLSNWNGQNGFGYWRLAVENNGSGKSGTISGYSVTITGTVLGPPAIGPNSIVSTSNLNGGSIAPGDQVSILGVNLGPSPGIRADKTMTLPTTLGSTTVTFDGIAAPLYYVSTNLVQAQVPFSLSPGATTKIQVKSSFGATTVVSLPVVTSNPGVLTHDAAGNGQAKAVNQDGTMNGDGSIHSSDVPAAAGTVITVLATGLGVVNPAATEGTVPPSGSTVITPVTATVGGLPATVDYAGLAPAQAGVGTYMVKITLPVRVQSGAARLVLSSDGNTSQLGATNQIQ